MEVRTIDKISVQEHEWECNFLMIDCVWDRIIYKICKITMFLWAKALATHYYYTVNEIKCNHANISTK